MAARETGACFADGHVEELPVDSAFWDMVKDAQRKAAVPSVSPASGPELGGRPERSTSIFERDFPDKGDRA